MNPSDRFNKAIAAFDAYHEKDPHSESEDGRVYPKELLYARRMTTRLLHVAPDAEEAVKLAARCQHIGRWEIPRDKYPMDRKGYLQWRNEEKIHHARIAEKILTDCGYDRPTIEKVKMLLLKKELYTNPCSQLLEDVVCLVFVEYYLEEFATRHDDDKIVDILRKTLRKMSDAGKQALAGIHVPDKIRELTQRALSAS